MESRLRFCLLLMVIASLLLTAPVAGWSAQLTAGPVAEEDPASGEAMIPVRGLVEGVGGTVYWEAASSTITMRVYGSPDAVLSLVYGSLNGTLLEVPPRLKEGVTYAPLLPLAAALGCSITWQDGGFLIQRPGAEPMAVPYRQIIGSATIVFSPGEAATANFANACTAGRYLDNKLVQPGQVFSFNQEVGMRSPERGFISGIVYKGKKDEAFEVGGGVCRTATLLHNAVLAAGLEVVERHRHSQPVTYVAPGRDATVYYGVLDYRFRNNRSYPIELEFVQTGTAITLRIWNCCQKCIPSGGDGQS